MSFPSQFINWVMNCVSTISYSLLINGFPSIPFRAQKGLHQGDPMSPFLFALSMEYFSRCLKRKKGDIIKFHPKYDLSMVYGLFVNKGKSALYVAGVDDAMSFKLVQARQVPKGVLSFRYLGNSGRDSQAKPHVAWSHVCLLKSCGGLNLSRLDLWNKVAMLKNLCSFAHKKDRLWFRWINDYYLKHSDVFSYIVPSITSWMLAKIFNSRRLVVNLQDQNDCAPHGHFSMKIAYKKLLGQHPKVPWRAIWYNNKATPTSVVCMWQAILNRLHTIDRLWKWGMSWDPMCRLCNAAPETRDHLFGDCVFIRKVKAFVCSDFHMSTSFAQDVHIMN
ncbi:uncharacterized protein LOC130808368 [Amaranthus tricolor]|uniref:uncharacterized protein LOC130808368 n=1 Tax=Amaranthus tricolor TaxID=29722 RepID=UPI00258B580A|nr:uncharacterized protein LOC130808368 [Amaranthus tricolor]